MIKPVSLAVNGLAGGGGAARLVGGGGGATTSWTGRSRRSHAGEKDASVGKLDVISCDLDSTGLRLDCDVILASTPVIFTGSQLLTPTILTAAIRQIPANSHNPVCLDCLFIFTIQISDSSVYLFQERFVIRVPCYRDFFLQLPVQCPVVVWSCGSFPIVSREHNNWIDR